MHETPADHDRAAEPGLPDPLYCVVEIPKGRRNKYEWDAELGAIALNRGLFTSVAFPTDYGFFPDTLAPDGDPLDAMVCVSAPTFAGCLIEVRPVGVLRMYDASGLDDKILCVPVSDPNWRDVRTLEDVRIGLRNEIAHFFEIYKDLSGEEVVVETWRDADVAVELILEARRDFDAAHGREPDAVA